MPRVFGGEPFSHEDVAQMTTAILAQDLGVGGRSRRTFLMAPGISSSKLGHPQSLANLSSER